MKRGEGGDSKESNRKDREKDVMLYWCMMLLIEIKIKRILLQKAGEKGAGERKKQKVFVRKRDRRKERYTSRERERDTKEERESR